jgi:hypothetical protein
METKWYKILLYQLYPAGEWILNSLCISYLTTLYQLQRIFRVAVNEMIIYERLSVKDVLTRGRNTDLFQSIFTAFNLRVRKTTNSLPLPSGLSFKGTLYLTTWCNILHQKLTEALLV